MHEARTPVPLADARSVPLTQIRPSDINPRTSIDKDDLAELVASVKERGVLEPILVRPAAKNGTAFEIVAGERRFRAAKKAGLAEIPALVREMSDGEAAEVALVENLHRKELRALEEADGFRRLQEQHHYTLEDIALKVGKSRSHVHSRLKLLALPEAAKKAFWSGELLPTVALLIARIPDQRLAAKATKEILDGGREYGLPVGEPMSHRRAAEHLHRNYMLSLAGAPFPTDDAKLVPEAGPCAPCPKRTRNQRDLFGEISDKADLCTDPPCFARKREAAWEKARAEATSKGLAALPDKEAGKLFHNDGRLAHGTKYVDLKDACEEDPKRRHWQRLLGKDAPKPVLARDEAGRVHELVPRGEAMKALKTAGHRFAQNAVREAAREDRSQKQYKEQEKRRRAREETLRAVSRAAIAAVVQKAETSEPSLPYWKLVLSALLRGSWHDTVADVVRRRGWAEKKARPEDVLRRQSADLKEPALRALVLEILITRFALPHWSGAGSFGEDLRAACKLYGVDLTKLGKRVQAERAAAKAKRPATRAAVKKPRS